MRYTWFPCIFPRHWLACFLVLVAIAMTSPVRADRNDAHFVTSDKVRLHYVDTGKGLPIVFVPGWTMPNEIWAPQITYFSNLNRVIVLDPRSQGDSDIAPGGHDPERRARDIAELVEHLKLERFVLVGWSLAVLESLAYTHFHGQDRLGGLVLVDNSIGEDPPPVGTDFLARYKKDPNKAMKGFVMSMFHTKRSKAYYDHMIKRSLKTPKQAALDLLGTLYPRERWREMVYAVHKPILYVVRPTFRGQAQNFKTHRPDAWVEVFEEAGHALFVDQPERFNTLLEHFIATEVEHLKIAPLSP